MVEHVGNPRNRVLPVPDLPRRAQNWTVAQIVKKSMPTRAQPWMQFVSIWRISKMRDGANRRVLRGETITRKPNVPPKRGHYCSYRPVDKNYQGPLSQCPAVLMTCNCDDWMYRFEYAAWYRGAAEILHGNGEYPESTNPSLKFSACKHLLLLGIKIIRDKL